MDIYKQASRKKLRFDTQKGSLSVEQLWDLDLAELDRLAVSLEDSTEKSAARSFLTESSEKNKIEQLRFDIALDVLQSKVADRDRAKAAAETRQRNQRIAEIIERKRDASLENMSLEELEGLLVA